MNYNQMVTRTGTCIPSHADLANLSYSHAGGSGFTAGVKRTAEEAGIKQELDSESLISSDEDDPLTEELSNSYVSRAMNIPVSTTATMPNIPHLSHFPGMAASTGLLQSCVPSAPSSSTSSQSQPGGKAPNGKKTKGRVKIKMEFIDNKLRRYTTFSKRKTGIMKKAYELSTLTGTQVMLLVASETGHVYTFATRKLQPMITSEAGKALIQTCLNSPDPPLGAGVTADQRMTPSGYEETELSYNIGAEDEQKYIGVSREGSPASSCSGSASASPTQDLLAANSAASSPSVPRSSPAHIPIIPINSGIATILAKGSGNVSNASSANGESSYPRMKMEQSTQQAASVLSSASTAGVSSPVMYQTAQGVVYAVPSPAHRTAIPEGVLLNLGSYLAAQQHTGSDNSKGSPGVPPNLIPIPLTVGLNSSSTTSTSTTSSHSHHHQAKSRK